MSVSDTKSYLLRCVKELKGISIGSYYIATIETRGPEKNSGRIFYNIIDNNGEEVLISPLYFECISSSIDDDFDATCYKYIGKPYDNLLKKEDKNFSIGEFIMAEGMQAGQKLVADFTKLFIILGQEISSFELDCAFTDTLYSFLVKYCKCDSKNDREGFFEFYFRNPIYTKILLDMFDTSKGCPHISGKNIDWFNPNENLMAVIFIRYAEEKSTILKRLTGHQMIFDLKLAYNLCKKHKIFIDFDRMVLDATLDIQRHSSSYLTDVYYDTFYIDIASRKLNHLQQI